MNIRVLKYIFLFTFISDTHSLFYPPFRMPKFVNFLEEYVIHNLYSNCSKFDIYTKTNYSIVKLSAAERIAELTLIQQVGTQEFIHKLSEAHTTIPASPQFDPKKPTVIFVHGWFTTYLWPAYLPIVNELKNVDSINFFMYNHTSLTTEEYAVASSYAHIAGDQLGDTLSKLYANGVRNFYCIGYSLGAHECGFAGKFFTKKTFQLLDRISGLDPSGPCFFFETAEFRLDSSDAKFVDVTHTDMNAWGIARSLGHVDFYPNSGENMLGCVIPGCSHLMNSFYYAESVKTKNFLAVRCSDWETFKTGSCANNTKVVMGYQASPDIPHGDYYLFVNPIPPFAVGEEGIAKPGFDWRKLL